MSIMIIPFVFSISASAEKAVAKSDDGIVVETVQGETDQDIIILPYAHALNTVRSTKVLPNFLFANLVSTVSYDKINKTFGSIYSVSLFGESSKTKVNNVVIKYTKIDGIRTLATTATSRVGVTSNGSTKYYPMYSYYEFYASSSGGKWFTNTTQ